MSEDYEIGYGKPPKRTQFKKGQSGNPRGRPQGAKGKTTVIKEIMNRKVALTINGTRKNLSQRDALLETLLVKAFKGSAKDQIAVMAYLESQAPNEFSGRNPITRIELVAGEFQWDPKTEEERQAREQYKKEP